MKKVVVIIISLVFILDSAAQNRGIDDSLLVAAYDNDLALVEKLLADSANVNAKTEEGVTPLMYAAQNGNDTLIDMLINYGALVNEKPVDGYTALISACLFNHLEAAVSLIEQSADINATTEYGATPLMIAAAYGYYVISDMLLYYGANTEIQDLYGNTALNIAATQGFSDIVGLLISKGALTDTRDEKGYTPLMLAVINNQIETAEALLEKKVNINEKNNEGFTPLMLALRARNDSMVQLLTALPFDASIRNAYGQSATEVALLNKNKCFRKCHPDKRFLHNYLPYLKSIEFTNGLSMATNDIMFYQNTGVYDVRNGLNLTLGYATRIGKKKILETINDSVFYQYNEKRSHLFAGITKDFTLSFDSENETGIEAGLRFLYSFGNIEGTTTKAVKQFLFSPVSGLYYSHDFITFRLTYSYFKIKTARLSPHKLELGASININVRKNPEHKKSIFWVN